MWSPILYLSEMLDAARAIRNFTHGTNLETFLEDEKTRSAVTFQLLILGEASKAIPADIKSRASNLDWRGMASMRDRLIHAYFVRIMTLYGIPLNTKSLRLRKESKN
jgi:uncharacterized protein with HEPN domain